MFLDVTENIPISYSFLLFWLQLNIILIIRGQFMDFIGTEKANPPRGGDAKSWVCGLDAY